MQLTQRANWCVAFIYPWALLQFLFSSSFFFSFFFLWLFLRRGFLSVQPKLWSSLKGIYVCWLYSSAHPLIIYHVSITDLMDLDFFCYRCFCYIKLAGMDSFLTFYYTNFHIYNKGEKKLQGISVCLLCKFLH